MKIMVTGGAGFIGSNVVDGLIASGHEVLVVDNLCTGKRANVNPNARFFEMDIRNPDMVRLMEDEKPDILNHHAAQMSVPDSVRDPLFDADVNIKGFLNLLEGAVKSKLKKVVFISSGGAIYGEAEEYPTSEAYPPKPLSPYAVSKFASEHYLACYRHQHGLDYSVLRYANIYGPRQIPHGEAGVVAIFMDRLLAGKPSTLYYFPGEDRGMVRDYCHVNDVVRANLLVLDRGSEEALNIGTGRETRTLDLYRIIFSAVQERRPDIALDLAEPRRALARPGDLTQSCLVVDKANGSLGWKPETDLETGIRQTLEWRIHLPL